MLLFGLCCCVFVLCVLLVVDCWCVVCVLCGVVFCVWCLVLCWVLLRACLFVWFLVCYVGFVLVVGLFSVSVLEMWLVWVVFSCVCVLLVFGL